MSQHFDSNNAQPFVHGSTARKLENGGPEAPIETPAGTIGDLADQKWADLIQDAIDLGASIQTTKDGESILSLPVVAVSLVERMDNPEFSLTTREIDGIVKTGYIVPEYLEPYLAGVIEGNGSFSSSASERSGPAQSIDAEKLDKVLYMLEELLSTEEVSEDAMKRWISEHKASVDTEAHPSGRPMIRMSLEHVRTEMQARANDASEGFALVYKKPEGRWVATTLKALTVRDVLHDLPKDTEFGHFVHPEAVSELLGHQEKVADEGTQTSVNASRAFGKFREFASSPLVRYSAYLAGLGILLYNIGSSPPVKNLLLPKDSAANKKPAGEDVVGAKLILKDAEAAQQTISSEPLTAMRSTEAPVESAIERVASTVAQPEILAQPSVEGAERIGELQSQDEQSAEEPTFPRAYNSLRDPSYKRTSLRSSHDPSNK